MIKVNRAVYDYVSPDTPKPLRLKAAEARADLAPADKLTVLLVLSQDADIEVQTAAKRSLENFAPLELLEALEGRLDPKVLKKVASMYPQDQAVLARIARNPKTDDETIEKIARRAESEAVIGIIAEDAERLARSPEIARALAGNPNTPGPVRELLERILNPDEIHERLTGEDIADIGDEEHESLSNIISRMTVAEKIKLALTGNKEARTILLRDSNKIISSSVLKNPRITEDEIVRLTASKSTADELLRLVARNREWLKNYQVKHNLVLNPKTPLTISMRLIGYLYKKDLEALAKSKNIPTVLATAARKTLEARKKYG